MDAQVKSEERYAKLAIAYEGKEEGQKVCSTIDDITSKYKMKPESYTCNISDKKEVVVVEYHDEDYRVVGEIFEKIIKELDIPMYD